MGGISRMVQDISRQGRHHKHVRLHMPFEKRDEFMRAVPKGLLVTLYAPPQLDPNQWVDPDEVNITVVANEHELDPQYRRHKEDIDAYLATINTIDNRIRILSDTVTKKEQPNLLEDWFIKNEVVLDHPMLDDLDHLRSKAANIHEVEVTESQLTSLETKYDEAKKEFIHKNFTNVRDTGKTNPATNEKIVASQQGEL